MSSSFLAALPEVELHPGKPPILWVDAPADAPAWAAENREALRGQVTEHGALLVRGLELRAPDQVGSVFRGSAAICWRTGRPSRPGRSAAPACTPPPSGPPTSRCACTTS